MVADRVTLVTRKAGAHTGVRWESTGEGTYTVAEEPDAPQGTSVTLHLKPEDAEDALHDFTKPATVRSTVKRYSDFITWPIRMLPDASQQDRSRRRDDTVDAAPEPVVINSRKALWARPQSEVSEEEYTEFYHHVSHDWQPPLETIRLSAEGTFEYQALLFLPSHAPMDLFMRDSKRGVQLYVKRVFIMDDCEALVPEYLRFVKGVVDANDLSLNISREILQQDRQIQLIRKRLVKKVLSTVKSMLEDEPEKYATFWSELGRAVKEGLISDYDNRDAILEICSFPSTNDPEKPTTLRDYLARMPEGQDVDLLRDRGIPCGAGELAAHGGLPREGLRGAAADRSGRRGVDRLRAVVRGQAAGLDRQGRGRSRRRRCRRGHQEGLRRPDHLDGRRPWPRTSRRSGSRTGSSTPPPCWSATRAT